MDTSWWVVRGPNGGYVAAVARPGELAFGAFGRQECRFVAPDHVCPEAAGSQLAHEMIARRVADEIAARSERAGGPAFALFTGDAADAATGEPRREVPLRETYTPAERDLEHRRWLELMAGPLSERLPLLGAIGGGDLSHVMLCDRANCQGTRAGAFRDRGLSATAGAGLEGVVAGAQRLRIGDPLEWDTEVGRWSRASSTSW